MQFQGQFVNRQVNPNMVVKAIDPLNDEIQGYIKERTHLIQLYTSDPDEGPRLISETHQKGVPIMILVDPPSCCYFKLNIPFGIVSLEQKWGKHSGIMEPGWHCCYLSYKKIAAMITKNSIRYNVSIEACPTKDDVKVSVDIGITFHIGEDQTREDDCQRFLYYLGANKLEEMLEQECEESIRNFVRTIKVSKIKDIKSELTTQMMAELNSRFQQYGVYIEQVTVMKVIIPRDLRIALQTATTYDVHLQNQIKYQENLILKLMNSENKILQSLTRDNAKKRLDLQNQMALETIALEWEKVLAETNQQLEVIKATEHQQVQIIKADAIKSQAKNRAQKEAEEILAKSKSFSEDKRIEAEAKAFLLSSIAQNRLDSSKLRSAALSTEADAESSYSGNLDNKRKHEEKMLMAEVQTLLASSNKIIIAGEAGEDLLSYFKDTSDLVVSKD